MTDLSLSARTRRVPLGAALRAAGAAVLALAFTVALAVCLSALTGCSSDEASSAQTGGEKATEGAPTAEAGVLMVASALNSEPYEQATSTSQIGFTVELLRLVGERAGLDVQFAKAVNHKDADQNITPREVIRDFIELLDLLYQNPGMDMEELLQSDDFTYAKSEAVSDETDQNYAEFTI